ncbi:hypothetical protein, partial [Treponema sp.]|uniref:hypothetical protein n=1 Tax=Treponema sp. TaxID=166 RepID=UPI00388D9727
GIILFVNYFGPQKNSGTLSGADFKLSAFSYDNSVYASLKVEKAAKKNMSEFENGIPVSVIFIARDKDGVPLQDEKLISRYEGNEIFIRTTFADYDIMSIGAVCSMNENYLNLECQIEKR